MVVRNTSSERSFYCAVNTVEQRGVRYEAELSAGRQSLWKGWAVHIRPGDAFELIIDMFLDCCTLEGSTVMYALYKGAVRLYPNNQARVVRLDIYVAMYA